MVGAGGTLLQHARRFIETNIIAPLTVMPNVASISTAPTYPHIVAGVAAEMTDVQIPAHVAACIEAVPLPSTKGNRLGQGYRIADTMDRIPDEE